MIYQYCDIMVFMDIAAFFHPLSLYDFSKQSFGEFNPERLKRGRGTLKQPVFGIFERNGKVYTEIVPDCKKSTLQAIILGRIALKNVIHTDGWRGYDGLVDVGYNKHFRVNHGANEFSKGHGKHINGIESFWSFSKRRLAKFNGVRKYFNLHLKECEWLWNKSANNLKKNY